MRTGRLTRVALSNTHMYQDGLAPVTRMYDIYKDGTYPLMIGYRRETQPEALASLTELIEANGLSCERKMLENFSNGVGVCSLYMRNPGYTHEKNIEVLQDTLDQVSTLFVSPKSSIIGPKYQDGMLSANGKGV